MTKALIYFLEECIIDNNKLLNVSNQLYKSHKLQTQKKLEKGFF